MSDAIEKKKTLDAIARAAKRVAVCDGFMGVVRDGEEYHIIICGRWDGEEMTRAFERLSREVLTALDSMEVRS